LFSLPSLLLLQGFLLAAISNGEAESNDASTLLQPFSACRARN